MIILKKIAFSVYNSLVIASINRRRSTTETKQTLIYDNDHDHEKSMTNFSKILFEKFNYLDVLLKKMNYVNLIDDN